ncbi:MAG: magnesium and cobalt transport protein CorA, partial [Gallionellaceae bacterium]|nr:magnesium and cobalt transport protein CorA [Gallionellaceae bacterium]
EVSCRRDLENIKPIWIDLLKAAKAERIYVGSHYGLELPDPGDATDLEVSSRFHVEENDEIHLHSNFLLDREGDSRSVPVAFILHDGILFSMRNEELPVFRLQRLRARTQPGYVSDGNDVLLDLYGADVEYSADSLEDVYATLGKVGRQVLSETMTDEEAAATLADIAEEEDLNGRIRSDILDTQRALSFLMRCKILSPSQFDDARQILRDIESLNSHTAFLFDKINFLMDATIGFININQNRRVSQLTVFGVVFMPINILAGIGGMSEYSMMTHGIPWPLAYGAFLVGMGLIGWGTYVAVKHMEKRRLAKPRQGAWLT